MATQTVQSWGVTGETLTMKLYTYNSDTAVASASATESTNRKGLFSASFSDLAEGSYIVQLQTSGGVVRSFFWVKTLAATGTYQAYEVPESVFAGSTGSVDVGSVSGSASAADKLEAILLASGSTDSSIAANMVATNLSATQIADITTTGKITRRRGDDWTIAVTGLGNITGYQNIWFGIKKNKKDADAKSEVLIDTTTGLRFIARGAASTPANGSITVNDATNGNITIVLKAVESAKTGATATDYFYEIQWENSSNTITTLEEGDFTVILDVIRETS